MRSSVSKLAATFRAMSETHLAVIDFMRLRGLAPGGMRVASAASGSGEALTPSRAPLGPRSP